MKQLIIGLFAGLIIGIVCAGCSVVEAQFIKTEPVQIVLTDRNHVTTTKVTTEEGTYRIFMAESADGNGGLGISAVKIK